MIPKGTRIIYGTDALGLRLTEERLLCLMEIKGYKFIIVPSLAYTKTFVDKAGKEILNTMYTFKDKGDRDLCLIPEVTAVIREEYLERLSKSEPKPVKVCYIQRCYRYDKPQAGRYREFTQFGVEWLGDVTPAIVEEVKADLMECVTKCGPKTAILNPQVKRGLDYYVEDGFEVEYTGLGAQKQIAGGGRYHCGIGWAIGVDRLYLALKHYVDNPVFEETHV